MKFISKHFGEIDFKNPQEYYEIEMQLNTKIVAISMSILSKNIDDKDIIKIDNYLTNFKENEKQIRQLLHQDFKNKRETVNYINLLKEEYPLNEILLLIESNKSKLTDDKKLLNELYLVQIAFYPNKEDKMFAVLDYTINDALTDDLLVVKCYKNESIQITIES